MTNLPITCSKPLFACNLAKAAPPASTAIAAHAKPFAQPLESFGALLGQQEALAPVASSPAIAIHLKTDSTAGKGDQEKALAAHDIHGDPSGLLAAMLQLSLDNKPPVVMEAKNGAATTTAGKDSGRELTAGSSIAQFSGMEVQDAATGSAGSASSDTTLPAMTPSTAFPFTAVLPAISSGKDSGKQPTAGSEIVQLTGMEVRDAALCAIQQASTGMTLPAQTPSALTDTRHYLPGNIAIRQTIATPLGSSDWASDFSQRINWMSKQQNQIAELRLNPPDLGPLDVVLKISDNQASALFISPHGAVRDAVENALPKLREILADNGIALGNTMVSDQSPRGRDAERFMGQGSGEQARREALNAPAGMEVSLTSAAKTPVRRHDGMIDIFA